ncbi:MAG: cation transporter [Magnetospirillum sp.]|nr:cation transporter [Magnetospirillum sp.]
MTLSPAVADEPEHPLWRFAALVHIAHHIPGRVRLKVSADADGALAAEEAKRFLRDAAQAAGIRSVNLNLLARSCVVEYDAKMIPPAAWNDLAEGRRSAAAEALLGSIARAGG